MGGLKLKLTHEQRAAFFRSDYPALVGEGTCPVELGHRYRLSSRLWIEVTGIRRPRRGGWRLQYIVHDRRPDRPRWLMPCSHRVPIGEDGKPAPMTDEEEHGYTSDRRRALDEAEGVPPDYQNVLVMAARQKNADIKGERYADQRARDSARLVGIHLRRVVIRAIQLGADPVPIIAAVEREVAAQERAMRDAA